MKRFWDEWFEAELSDRQLSHMLRSRVALRHLDATHVQLDGQRLVNFASNNYLGLTHHPRVLDAIRCAASAGSGAAGLITGYTDAHASAETALARWKGTEASVLLPSGYQANHAVVQTFAGIAERSGGVRFLVDKLAHASLIDAVRGSGLPFRVFPHNGLEKLRRLLVENEQGGLQVVITESIFSMDGDAADLAGVASLKREKPFALVLDEAHAAGVYGPNGSGLAAEMGFQSDVDVSIATLSKAIGCVGGVVCASKTFCDAMMNLGRAYIFSTSIPPFVAMAAEAAIDVMADEPARQTRVRELARRFRSEIGKDGDSPIVPITLGSEDAALKASERLRSKGFWVPAVRPPTVPKGTSRLRITLSCEHTDDELEALREGLNG